MRVTSPLDHVRRISLALPEAHEVIAWGEPTFRVRNKLFAMYASANNHHGGGKNAIWCKSTPIKQDVLIRADPGRFFKPPYVGPSGWIGVYLDGNVDWETVADELRDAYRLVAPKRLRESLESGTSKTESAARSGTSKTESAARSGTSETRSATAKQRTRSRGRA
ncbi:MAG: MmcQ/YjbR family DNA-binding protein [Gemmatimonadaceae bacterium]